MIIEEDIEKQKIKSKPLEVSENLKHSKSNLREPDWKVRVTNSGSLPISKAWQLNK